MPNVKKLRHAFDELLRDVWQEWDDVSPEPNWSPFLDLNEVPQLDQNPGYNYNVAWLTGVSDALDWSRARPLGPKQWSPKGRHPR